MNIELNLNTQTFVAATAALIITWVMTWGFVDATRVVHMNDLASAVFASATMQQTGDFSKVRG